jgi:UDP-N-acetylmuramoyl-tripeptide--D-alanyl-D-alanine ligase
MRWTAAAIADAVGGTLTGPDVDVESVTQDSREIAGLERPLFVPLLAERDGHDFIGAAVGDGAVAYLTGREPLATDGSAAAIRVTDTAAALTALGAAARDRLDGATVVGITGSVGKTTTKDLLAAVLAGDRRTHANVRSFNNEIGVPLTLLGAPDDAEAVVLEMGARGIGHIAELCAVARPTVGVVTTVGIAHTSEFGSVDAVAEAKGELIEALPAEGLAVLNADVPSVAAMAARTQAVVVTFGERGEVRAEDLSLDDDLTPRFRLVAPQGSAVVVLGARGIHLVDNALAAAAVGLHLGMAPDVVAARLAVPVLSPMRMALARTASGARVLDDTYNANPMSTAGALRSLAHLRAARRTAVLGVMAELGEVAAREHAAVAALAEELGIHVVAVDAPDYVGADVEHVGDIGEARARLGPLGPDDAVLVKGSRVAGLERLVDELLNG